MSSELAIRPMRSDAFARERKLTLDQLGLALRNLRPNAWMMPALAGVICVMFHRWVPTAVLAIWFALVVIADVPLAIVSRRYGHLRSAAENPRHVVSVSTLAYVGFTLAWSSLGIFLWVPESDLARLIVIMLLACTVAGNGALVGASRELTIASYICYGGALILTPLRAGDLTYNGISILAALYVGYMTFMSRQIYLTARDMLLLRYEKNDLIDALAHSKSESDRARDHAERASRTKSQFLANMSHELRTPLNAILGFSEMITSRVFESVPEKQYEYAGLIHSSGYHLLTLINDILDLAKIESGSWSLNEKTIDLRTLINATCAMLEPKTAAGGCILATDLDANLPLVRCDERATKQILLNLASNAVKFTPRGGRITIFAHLQRDGAIAFGVSDTGVGISEDDQQRVFENFGQGRHDVVTADKGTGLGLPIVKGLVEAHGGRVTLVSAIGEGTTVTIRYPSARTTQPQSLMAAS